MALTRINMHLGSTRDTLPKGTDDKTASMDPNARTTGSATGDKHGGRDVGHPQPCNAAVDQCTCELIKPAPSTCCLCCASSHYQNDDHVRCPSTFVWRQPYCLAGPGDGSQGTILYLDLVPKHSPCETLDFQVFGHASSSECWRRWMRSSRGWCGAPGGVGWVGVFPPS